MPTVLLYLSSETGKPSRGLSATSPCSWAGESDSHGRRWSKRRGQWSHSCGHSGRPARSYRPWDKYQTISLDQALSTA